jgi:hypothetical protein
MTRIWAALSSLVANEMLLNLLQPDAATRFAQTIAGSYKQWLRGSGACKSHAQSDSCRRVYMVMEP